MWGCLRLRFAVKGFGLPSAIVFLGPFRVSKSVLGGYVEVQGNYKLGPKYAYTCPNSKRLKSGYKCQL